MYDFVSLLQILYITYIFRGTVVILVSRFYVDGEFWNERTLKKIKKKVQRLLLNLMMITNQLYFSFIKMKCPFQDFFFIKMY